MKSITDISICTNWDLGFVFSAWYVDKVQLNKMHVKLSKQQNNPHECILSPAFIKAIWALRWFSLSKSMPWRSMSCWNRLVERHPVHALHVWSWPLTSCCVCVATHCLHYDCGHMHDVNTKSRSQLVQMDMLAILFMCLFHTLSSVNTQTCDSSWWVFCFAFPMSFYDNIKISRKRLCFGV